MRNSSLQSHVGLCLSNPILSDMPQEASFIPANGVLGKDLSKGTGRKEVKELEESEKGQKTQRMTRDKKARAEKRWKL